MKAIATKTDKCKGLFFRGYSSIFFNYKKGKLECRSGISLLKKDSCKGCGNSCERFFLEEMQDIIDCEGIIIPEIENGAIYQIRVVNITTEWESGQIDGYDFEVYKKEEK